MNIRSDFLVDYFTESVLAFNQIAKSKEERITFNFYLPKGKDNETMINQILLKKINYLVAKLSKNKTFNFKFIDQFKRCFSKIYFSKNHLKKRKKLVEQFEKISKLNGISKRFYFEKFFKKYINDFVIRQVINISKLQCNVEKFQDVFIKYLVDNPMNLTKKNTFALNDIKMDTKVISIDTRLKEYLKMYKNYYKEQIPKLLVPKSENFEKFYKKRIAIEHKKSMLDLLKSFKMKKLISTKSKLRIQNTIIDKAFEKKQSNFNFSRFEEMKQQYPRVQQKAIFTKKTFKKKREFRLFPKKETTQIKNIKFSAKESNSNQSHLLKIDEVYKTLFENFTKNQTKEENIKTILPSTQNTENSQSIQSMFQSSQESESKGSDIFKKVRHYNKNKNKSKEHSVIFQFLRVKSITF